jgi:hypothetical protein
VQRGPAQRSATPCCPARRTFSASVKFIGVLWKLKATPLLLTNLKGGALGSGRRILQMKIIGVLHRLVDQPQAYWKAAL